jgi:hypothetical protein
MDQVLKITQAYSETPWRKQMQRVGMFLAILVLGLVIAIIYVDVSAEAASAGRKIQDMQSEIEILERLIADKQSQLAYTTSAVEMETRALEMNFQPLNPSEASYIVVPGYAGRIEVTLAPPSEPAVAQTIVLSPEYSISLVDWLKQQLYLPTGP